MENNKTRQKTRHNAIIELLLWNKSFQNYVSFLAKAPTSYEGPYGKIIYQIRAFIDTPRFSKDYKAEKHFYMLNQLDLNLLPDIFVSTRSSPDCLTKHSHSFPDRRVTEHSRLLPQEPNKTTVSKNFTYMLVKNGTVEVTAKTDQRGYTSGQVIKVSTAIDNKSGKSTGTIVASLIQVMVKFLCMAVFQHCSVLMASAKCFDNDASPHETLRSL